MENIVFDTGVKEYCLSEGGVLRFNPSDPNLYVRFLDALEKVKALEKELTERAEAVGSHEETAENGAAALRLMQEVDGKIKDILTEVFGPENDFRKLMGGLNLLAVGSNGKRILVNLLAALQPILAAGAQSYADLRTEEAVAQAKQNRARRKEE